MAKTAAEVCAAIAGCCGKVDPAVMPTYIGILLCELVAQSSAPTLTASSNGTPITTATTTVVVADPGDTKQIQVRRIYAVNNGVTTTDVGWKETAGTLMFNRTLATGDQIDLSFVPGEWVLTASTAFNIVTTAAGSVSWVVEYDLLDV